MKKEYKWKVKISDGYCEYEYTYATTNGNVSIHDISEVICRKLKGLKKEGKFIKALKAKRP
jgi:hypothetical protein